jgi:hypothetical protein
MGGQACVFYGAAQFSKDVDFVLLPSEDNFARFLAALGELKAQRIAVPQFDPTLQARGHAVHFRCGQGETEGLLVDVMTQLRDLPTFEVLWERRTTIKDQDGTIYELLSVEDLVAAKKTQRERDWPVIEALVEGHYRALRDDPTPERIAFWLKESRTPERLFELTGRFPEETRVISERRSLLRVAILGEFDHLREALDAETRAEQAKDRAYWAPLKAELEALRHAQLRRS